MRSAILTTLRTPTVSYPADAVSGLGQLTVTPGICLIGSTRGAMRMERRSTISLATTSPSAITVLSSIRTPSWSALWW